MRSKADSSAYSNDEKAPRTALPPYFLAPHYRLGEGRGGRPGQGSSANNRGSPSCRLSNGYTPRKDHTSGSSSPGVRNPTPHNQARISASCRRWWRPPGKSEWKVDETLQTAAPHKNSPTADRCARQRSYRWHGDAYTYGGHSSVDAVLCLMWGNLAFSGLYSPGDNPVIELVEAAADDSGDMRDAFVGRRE